jgi:DNA repair exonuclease SbcCD ATPase subunit
VSDTGHKKELSDATTHLADALASADPAALRKAAGDHATALNSQATAMAASIAAPVYSRLGEVATQIQELAHIVTNARQADLNWRTEERSTRDAQSTRLYAELDKLILAAEDNGARLGKIEARLAADEQRLDSKRARIEALESDVQALKAWVTGLPTPEESRRLIALLEQLAAERTGDGR